MGRKKNNNFSKLWKKFKEDKLIDDQKDNKEIHKKDSNIKLKLNKRKVSRNSPGESEEDTPVTNRALIKKNKINEKKRKNSDVSNTKSKDLPSQFVENKTVFKKKTKTRKNIETSESSDSDYYPSNDIKGKVERSLKKSEKNKRYKSIATSYLVKEKEDEIKSFLNNEEEKPIKKNIKNKRSKKIIEESENNEIELVVQTDQNHQIKEELKENKSLFELNDAFAVDEFLPDNENYQVIIDGENEFNGIAWDCKLNYSDLINNNNKFYVIQLLTDKSTNQDYYLYIRYGRVGYQGQTSFQRITSLDYAKKEFLKKYKQKTKTYTEIIINYKKNDKKKDNQIKEKPEIKKVTIEKSSLNPSVQSLINLIYNKKFIDEHILEIGYDSNKLPLGKLGKPSIIKGFEILKRIEEVLNGNSHEDIYDLSSLYYTFIPHCFGFQKMKNFVIDTMEKLNLRVSNLESLSDIEIATKILDESHDTDYIIDQHYKRLNCKIELLSPSREIYKLILDYFNNTINKNFDLVDIKEIFEVYKEEEDRGFNLQISNKMLLWHGSRITNFVGILNQGLRIAPKEAPVSGYLYGKGIYFADMASKSLNYCYPNKKEGLLLLCEVAVGEFSEKFQPDFNSSNLPDGTQSTKAVGDIFPPLESYVNYEGINIPLGAPDVQNGFKYNEYVVYNVNQVKMKYLLRLKWK